MSLTLTVVDDADGDGATATIAGSVVGSTNTVSVQAADGETWTEIGERTGDGTLALALDPGYYWAKCDSVSGGNTTVSNVVRFGVTTAGQSVHERILDAVRAEIQGMVTAGLLPGLRAEQVHRKMVPDDKAVMFPAVFITPEAAETFTVVTNLRDDIGYPAVVYLANRNAKEYTAGLPPFLLWRHRIIRRFRTQRLTAVREVFGCTIEPNVVIDPKLPWYDYVVSAFLLRFKAREYRG